MPWNVANSTSAGPTSTLISGTTHSVNTFFAYLEARTGICEPANIATRLGAVRADGDPLIQIKPFTVGVNEIAPLSMAEAYATFAARGLHCSAIPYTQVNDRSGNQLKVKGADCKQAIPKDVADAVTYVLREVVDGKDPGRTGQAMSMAGEGRQVAGKTGTSNDRIAVWFMGFTSNLVAASVVTDADPPLRTLLGARIAGRTVGGNQVWGGTLAGPMWLASMRGALAGKKSPNFARPNSDIIKGVPVGVPSVLGMWQRQAEPLLRDAGFKIVVGGTVASALPKGQIVRQSPSPNRQAGSGATVTVYLSDGTPPSPNPLPGPRTPPDFSPDPDEPGPGGSDGQGISGLMGASPR